MALNIGFILFPGFTQLDVTGPWEVFTRLSGAHCHLVAADSRPVVSDSGGMAIMPTLSRDICPQLDVLCVPGGPGHLTVMEDEAWLDFLRRQAAGCRYVTAVCTGSMVLAAAGLLTGARATTHWLSLPRLAAFGAFAVSERVVKDGKRITGGGITAGIDFGLTLAGELAGADAAREIELFMEYAPAPPFACGTPQAAPQLAAEITSRMSAYRARMAEVDARAAAKLRL